MTIDEVNNQEMYALFAPDGTWQAMTLAVDLPHCIAAVKMLNKAGLCKSFHQLSLAGFKVLPVIVSMKQK